MDFYQLEDIACNIYQRSEVKLIELIQVILSEMLVQTVKVNFKAVIHLTHGWKTERFLVPFRPGALFSVAGYPRLGLSP